MSQVTDVRSDHNYHLSGPATLAIISLVIAGLSACVLVATISDSAGSLAWSVCGLTLAGSLLVGGLSVTAGLLKSPPGEPRTAAARRVVVGFCLIGAAGLLTLLSATFGVFHIAGAAWFVVPTGLYGAGIASIARGLTPRHNT